MNRLQSIYEEWTDNPYNGECLYLLGFTIMLFRDIMITTMFPISDKVSHICLLVALLIILSKILLFDSYSPWMLIVVMGLMGTGVLIVLSSGYIYPFLWLLLVIGAKDVSFEKIVKIYLILSISIVGLAFSASMLGVIENLVYIDGESGAFRNSFGCAYTTDFAAHIFYIILAIFYIQREKLSWCYYVCTTLVAGLIYYFCRAKLDTICILLTVLAFGVYSMYKHQGKKEIKNFRWQVKYQRLKRLIYKVGIVIMPVLAIVAFVLTSLYKYSEEETLIMKIDKLSTTRLSMGKRALEKYSLAIFGQDVPMVGNGGTTKLTKEYFFVDCSYIFVYLRYGIIFLLILFLMYEVIVHKCIDNTEMFIIVILMSVSSVIDHHLVEGAYNFIGFALLANIHKQNKFLQRRKDETKGKDTFGISCNHA